MIEIQGADERVHAVGSGARERRHPESGTKACNPHIDGREEQPVDCCGIGGVRTLGAASSGMYSKPNPANADAERGFSEIAIPELRR